MDAVHLDSHRLAVTCAGRSGYALGHPVSILHYRYRNIGIADAHEFDGARYHLRGGVVWVKGDGLGKVLYLDPAPGSDHGHGLLIGAVAIVRR